jgi:hypothetical protein
MDKICTVCGELKPMPTIAAFDRDFPGWCSSCIHGEVEFLYREWQALTPEQRNRRIANCEGYKMIHGTNTIPIESTICLPQGGTDGV